MRGKSLAWHGPIITFVAPWYGPNVPGGAEFQCRRTAEELVARGVPTEIFTTTAGGVTTDWSALSFPHGRDQLNGVPIQRFAVRPRNYRAFDALNIRLMRGERISLAEEAVFLREIIGSDELEGAILREWAERLFVFTPYMFGTTYWGAQLASGRAFLIPCVHDEAYLYLQAYRQLIELADGLIFYSAAEQRLAQRVCRLAPERQCLLGGGIETEQHGDAARFRARFGLTTPFMLYAGRRDVGKNTPLLLDYFRRYRAEGGYLRLVTIGSGDPLPADLLADGSLIDLGFVSAQEKLDAYAAAEILVQPSLNESFSVVIMESWVNGRPVLVHSDCPVTREFAEESGGGLAFRSYPEFHAALQWLARHPRQAEQMGAAGRAYVQAQFSWDQVTQRLTQFLAQRCP